MSGKSERSYSWLDSAHVKPQEKNELVEMDDSRDGEHLITNFQGSMMLLKICVGTGIFGLPASFKSSGILAGAISILIIGALTAFGMQQTVVAAWEVSERTGILTVTFGDLGEECAKVLNPKRGHIGRLFVDVYLSFTSVLLICPMIVFGAGNFKQVATQMGLSGVSTESWTLVVFFILLPLFLIRRSDILSIFATFANIVLTIAIGSVFIHILINTSHWEANFTITWSKLPLTFGIILFAYEAAPLILSIENAMKNPRQIPSVINGVLFLVTILYTLIGAIGYASCQDECRDSITLNLPSAWYFSLVKILIGLAACVSCTLLGYLVINITEALLLKEVPEGRHQSTMSLFLRTFLLTLTCGIAAAVPQLGNLMSLVGSLAVTTVGFIFPALANMILLHQKLSRLGVAKNILLLVCGAILFISVAFVSLQEIVKDY